MSDLFREPEDATPLAPHEQHGLLQSWITHRRDLNEAERDNIVRGQAWARRARSLKANDCLTDPFARNLHRHMFGEVWAWAGSYRTTPRNIGVEPWRIASELALMFDDIRYQVAHRTYPPDEIAIRFHHRLVLVHPFPNGNGRHSRLIADLLLERLGGAAFSWGGGRLGDAGDLRARYIAALRIADNHDIAPLLAFARS